MKTPGNGIPLVEAFVVVLLFYRSRTWYKAAQHLQIWCIMLYLLFAHSSKPAQKSQWARTAVGRLLNNVQSTADTRNLVSKCHYQSQYDAPCITLSPFLRHSSYIDLQYFVCVVGWLYLSLLWSRKPQEPCTRSFLSCAVFAPRKFSDFTAVSRVFSIISGISISVIGRVVLHEPTHGFRWLQQKIR